MRGFLNLQEQPRVSQREHPALHHNMIFENFFHFVRGIFSFPDTDPDSETQSNPDRIRVRIRNTE